MRLLLLLLYHYLGQPCRRPPSRAGPTAVSFLLRLFLIGTQMNKCVCLVYVCVFLPTDMWVGVYYRFRHVKPNFDETFDGGRTVFADVSTILLIQRLQLNSIGNRMNFRSDASFTFNYCTNKQTPVVERRVAAFERKQIKLKSDE